MISRFICLYALGIIAFYYYSLQVRMKRLFRQRHFQFFFKLPLVKDLSFINGINGENPKTVNGSNR